MALRARRAGAWAASAAVERETIAVEEVINLTSLLRTPRLGGSRLAEQDTAVASVQDAMPPLNCAERVRAQKRRASGAETQSSSAKNKVKPEETESATCAYT